MSSGPQVSVVAYRRSANTDRPAPAVQTSPPPRLVTDAIVARFRAGDVEALAVVYDTFVGAVWSTALRVLGDRHLAEDATQETFIRAWRAAAEFDPSRPMSPWLCTIARRTAFDVHRREHRPTRGDHAEEQDIGVDAPAMVDVWEAWEVAIALGRLTPDERDVVWLSHFHGLTHTQIAERLAVPVGTVKSRSSRAHRRLAGLLAHLGRTEQSHE